MQKITFYTKESYSVKNNALELVEKLNFNYAQKKHVLNLKKAALLTIDAQNYFFNAASTAFIASSPQIITSIKQLQNFFLANNILCLQTKHIDDANGKMQNWWGRSILDDEIVSSLQNTGITIIKKRSYDAFWQTSLKNILKAHGITQIIIVGVCTHLCCETTARAAFIQGFDVFIVLDAVCAHNKNINNNSIINLAHGFVAPILLSDIYAKK